MYADAPFVCNGVQAEGIMCIGRKRGGPERGFTLIELLIVVAIIAIIAAIAVPGLLRARQSGNEASAIGTLRTVSSAQITYSSSCGGGGYAQALADLAKGPPSGSGFVSPDLAADPSFKSGYEIVLEAEVGANTVAAASATCNSAANNSVSAFWLGARPTAVGASGQRSFATDTRGALFQESTGSSHIANPIPSGTAVLQ
jgi:prepilin-type N-terminal cleavage/methylation domain-containing protein